MKSSQSNFDLRSPGSYLVRSYRITTVQGLILEGSYLADFLFLRDSEVHGTLQNLS